MTRFLGILALCSCVLWIDGCDSAAANTPNPPNAAQATAATSPAPPGTPTAVLQVSAQPGDTVIRLNWRAVPGASGYAIYRDGRATPLNATPTRETTYDDFGLSNGKTYTYIVAAVDAGGQSAARSEPITAAPQAK